MIPGETTDILFRSLYHEALVLVGATAGASSRIRGIYRAAVIDGNPKRGVVLARELLAELDDAANQLHIFRAQLLAISAEIESGT
jgi:hypothetical protein